MRRTVTCASFSSDSERCPSVGRRDDLDGAGALIVVDVTGSVCRAGPGSRRIDSAQRRRRRRRAASSRRRAAPYRYALAVRNATNPIRSISGRDAEDDDALGVPETETNRTLPSCVDTEANGEPERKPWRWTASTLAPKPGTALAINDRNGSAGSVRITVSDFFDAHEADFQLPRNVADTSGG